MKASVKYNDLNIFSLFKDLKKEYEVYKNQNGFYVINVLNIEVPIFQQKNQTFDLFYKVSKTEEKTITPDRNGFYKITLQITLDKKTLEELN